MNRRVFRSRAPLEESPRGAVDGEALVGREVGVVCVVGGAPILTGGQVVRAEGAVVHVELTREARLPQGARAILELAGGGGSVVRHIVTIVASTPSTLALRLVDARPLDRREYPRLRGTVLLRYRPRRDAAERIAWLRGDEAPGPFRSPAPSMDFSATGLAFVDDPVAARGDELLMEIALPGDSRTWRCVGTVVRVGAAEPDAEGGTHEIAVRLDVAPREATIALARYTLRVQEASMDDLFTEGDAN